VSRATPVLLAAFFAIATCILFSVGLALVYPGATPFDAIWTLKPERRALLMPYRMLAGPGFIALAMVFVLDSAGCFLRRDWGRKLAIVIFAANGIGDVVQLSLGHYLEGAIGVTVAGFLILALTRPHVRAAFDGV
jgi:hypothetical protein